MITATLFMFSAVAHHVLAAQMMPADIAMPAAMASMASPDHEMPCSKPSDCAKDMTMKAMACFAHCAMVLGVLAESVVIPVSFVARPLALPAVHELASLHGPPEPHPPKSLS